MEACNFSIQVKNKVLEIENNIHPVPNVWVHYRLYDKDNKIIRKGTFSGKKVQMRLSDLTQGDYFIELLNNSRNIITTDLTIE